MEDVNKTILEYLKSKISNTITETDDFFELRLVNSLFYIQLINFLEKTFSIKIENEDLDLTNFNTATNIASFIRTKVKNPR